MASIEKIDKNLAVGATINKEGLVFYNALEAPFKIYGIYMHGGRFRRMPEEVAAQVSQGVLGLHACTAGGRLRFKTNSRAIAISAKMPEVYHGAHFALSGSSGFDLYEETDEGVRYVKTFMPKVGMTEGYESLLDFEETNLLTPEFQAAPDKMRTYLIHFPTYSKVSEVYIGIKEGAMLEAAEEYKYTKPFVVYGSSITQGGCASRSGNAYPSILSRRFSYDHINLGFSGSAKAEDAMIEYLSGLDMSFFIYDYDHNANDNEHYAQTHEKLFKAVRTAHPDLPILILTRPRYYLNSVGVTRREIAYKTYENALAAGDKRVWFMDGKQLMALCGDEGTVDNCHPTDFGFHSMAKAIGDWMEENKILEMI